MQALEECKKRLSNCLILLQAISRQYNVAGDFIVDDFTRATRLVGVLSKEIMTHYMKIGIWLTSRFGCLKTACLAIKTQFPAGIALGLVLVAARHGQSQSPDPIDVRTNINNSAMATKGTSAPVGEIKNLMISVEDRKIPARLYRPKEEGPLPVLVFFHGGGFVRGNLDTHDRICRCLCNRITCLVLAVDYRLAPEHKFPAQTNDCYAATVWAEKNAENLGGDPDRLAVIGDSAGGTLVAAVCLMARDKKGPKIRYQVLVNPALDCTRYDDKTKFPSSLRRFRDFYLKEAADGTNPYASPLLATDFQGLPPAFVFTGEKDALRDEGEEYAEKLRDAGVHANAYRQHGEGHLASRWAAAAPVAEEPLDLAVGVLRAAFRAAK